MKQRSTQDADTEPGWRDRAECQGEDPALFFPVDSGEGMAGVEQYRVRAAKAICRGCPVIDSCYNFAVSQRWAYGVYGGELFNSGRVGRRRARQQRPVTRQDVAA